jgi:CHAT domain-containing protein
LAHDVAYRRPPLHDGSLVILNGCRTGCAITRGGRGHGPHECLPARGAGLVLATQWSVIDLCAAEVVLHFADAIVRPGVGPTQALRDAVTHVRRLTLDQLLARCDEARKLFPPDRYPIEAGRLLALKAWLCRGAGKDSEAQTCVREAVTPLRRAGLETEAEQLLRAQSGGQPYRIKDFDHPIFWGAFHFVGRVT